MKIDINKKYRYRNGEPARVICVDVVGGQPVVSVTDYGQVRRHEQDGSYYPDVDSSPKDLIEVREPLECWAWVSESGEMSDGAMTVEKPGNPNYRKFREIID